MTEPNFLDIIRATEQQAADIIDRAADEAKMLQEEARQTATGIISRAREAAALLQRQTLEEADAQSRQIAGEAAAAAAVATAQQTAALTDRLEAAAQMVAERIVNDNAHR